MRWRAFHVSGLGGVSAVVLVELAGYSSVSGVGAHLVVAGLVECG